VWRATLLWEQARQVPRHGCYKRDLERFAEALLKKHGMPLIAEMEKQEPETRPSNYP